MLMAVKRNVQKLHLEIGDYYDLAFELPRRLFNCKSLRKLELVSAGVAEHRKIILPKSMCLPQLEALALVKLSISSVELENLISSCPLLNQLHMFKCDIQAGNQQNLVIDSPSLQTFALTDTPRSFRLEDCIVDNITKLSAPNLESFVFKGFMTQNYCLENFSFLDTVSINMRLGENETTERYSTLLAEEKEVFAGRMMKYLGAFYNARILILSPGLMEVLSQAPDLLNCQRLRFCNLRRIDLEMWFTSSSLHSLAYLFEISPIISHLFLTSKKTRITEVGDNWEVGLSFPSL
ncbi:hypothetical protein MKW98_012031 [Papaver atlanticum]|uniref:F-box/LRR-repeat protein 15/At3g58940/PEG3-like LRR domain-containing protein n=1 Tax=Papaver atlanticum TaxID=357466 RepID=A0AAD4SMJ6_9MAGN|nr:hypothetical protein MKW98_012031 [Papaver atlanticum]